jgi:hypothetical protein
MPQLMVQTGCIVCARVRLSKSMGCQLKLITQCDSAIPAKLRHCSANRSRRGCQMMSSACAPVSQHVPMRSGETVQHNTAWYTTYHLCCVVNKRCHLSQSPLRPSDCSRAQPPTHGHLQCADDNYIGWRVNPPCTPLYPQYRHHHFF